MTLVLLSGGLDSALLLALTARQGDVTPVHVRCGYAWEDTEAAYIARLLASEALSAVGPLRTLHVDMRDVMPAGHWALTGRAPAYATADEEVYLDGRNVTLIAKAAVLASRLKAGVIALGLLKGNPFPDATPEFLGTMARAVSLGLAHDVRIETPLAGWSKTQVVKEAARIGLPFDLTISCMSPDRDLHCGRCSKCRERHDAFVAAGLADPTAYASRALVDRPATRVTTSGS